MSFKHDTFRMETKVTRPGALSNAFESTGATGSTWKVTCSFSRHRKDQGVPDLQRCELTPSRYPQRFQDKSTGVPTNHSTRKNALPGRPCKHHPLGSFGTAKVGSWSAVALNTSQTPILPIFCQIVRPKICSFAKPKWLRIAANGRVLLT